MRTRINISHATPGEIKNLTLALQNVTVLDAFDYDEDRHPRIWVHDDGDMGWGSPSISRQRAADVLREFDRLNAGLFDHGAKMSNHTISTLHKREAAPELDVHPEDRPDTGTFEEMDERDGKPSPEPLTVGTEVYYRGEPGWVVTGQPSDEPGMVVIANDKRNRTVPISVLEEVEQPSTEPEAVNPLAGNSEHYAYYTSEDNDGSWSVYGEAYPDENMTEPIPGTTTRVGAFDTEAEADAEASRLNGIAKELFGSKE